VRRPTRLTRPGRPRTWPRLRDVPCARATASSWASLPGTTLSCLLVRRPMRLDHELAVEFLAWRRTTCGNVTLANDLHLLRRAIGYMCPTEDLSWLRPIANRIAALAQPKPTNFHLVTSDQLYALGNELMDGADQRDQVRKVDAFQYRDGLIIALLALIPLRRRTLACGSANTS
jgi:hypothetical protein